MVGVPNQELMAEIWPKKQLWQNCSEILRSQKGGAEVVLESRKGNAAKVVLTVEQNNWSQELAPVVRELASVSGRR